MAQLVHDLRLKSQSHCGPDVSARSVRLHKLELNNARLARHGDDDAW